MTGTTRYPHRLCAPADKNGEGIVSPVQHLTGYVMRRMAFERQTGLTVTNQFGTLVVDATRPNVLMVPSAKSLTTAPPPLVPPTIDHFQCYKVKRSNGAAKFVKRTVTVEDQLESQTLTVTRPFVLCAPANKNGEDPTAPSHPTYLMCYRTVGTPFGTLAAHINNQFGLDDVTLIHRRELCVPSSVQ
jgi:hypothetical protein